MSAYNILFGISGSIGAYKVLNAVSALVKAGHQVQCVGTPSSLKFIGEASVEGLTGRPFLVDTFTQGHMMEHIHLARWAHIYVVAPASANTLAKMANGLTDDLVSTLFLAADKNLPLLVAPAMNPAMWENAATQKNVKRLKKRGVKILAPESGRTACGEVGEGRLIEPEDLVGAIEARLQKAPTKGKILITSGGTIEPIDSVRAMTNTSTGRTGATLADELTRMGYEVHLAKAKSAVAPVSSLKTFEFKTTEDLSDILEKSLGAEDYLAVIHAAAVSDYSVDQITINGQVVQNPIQFKMDSNQTVEIKLKSNPKLIDHLRDWSKNKNIKVIGFKLTDTTDTNEQERKILELFKHSASDLVVHNDASNIGLPNHSFKIFNNDLNGPTAIGAVNLAQQLQELL